MIYIYGDSHSNYSFKNLSLPHRNFYKNSITMFRIGRDSHIINFDKENIAKDTNTNNLIILSYGEIDCRCHIHRQVNLQRDEDDIIYELVNNYIKAIHNNTEGIDANVLIVGVIPPTKKSDYENLHGRITHKFPFIGSDEDRVRYTQKINKLLEELSNKNDFNYFNPYHHYTRDDGTLKYELSDNVVHIGDNTYFLEQFIELYGRRYQ